MSATILLISLILAIVAGYFFIQWKCPSKQEQLQQIMENSELEEELDFKEIKTSQRQLSEQIKKIKELSKKKEEELSEEEKTTLANLPILQEIQSLTHDIEKKEDLNKKVISAWDYVWVGGVFIAVFLVSIYLSSKFLGIMKGEVEK